MVWRKDTPILYQINEFIAEMGVNFDKVMDNYFEDFKERIIIDSGFHQDLWKITRMMFVSWLTVTKCTYRQSYREWHG